MAERIRIEFVIEDTLDDDEFEPLPSNWDQMSEEEQRAYLSEVEDSAVWRHITATASVVDATEQHGADRG